MSTRNVSDRVQGVVSAAGEVERRLFDVRFAAFEVTTRPGSKETFPGFPPIPAVSVDTRWVSVDTDEQRYMPVSVAPLVSVLETAGVHVAGAKWTRDPRRITITVVADTSETVDHVSNVLRDCDLVAVSDTRDARRPRKAILAYEYDMGDLQIHTISSEEYAS